MMMKQKQHLSDYVFRFHNANANGNTFLITQINNEASLSKVKGPVIDRLNIYSRDSGLVFYEINHNLYKMHVIEKDGSESNFCGNGARALANYLYTFNQIILAKLQIKNGEINFGKKGDKFFVECGRPHSLDSLKIDKYSFDRFNVCEEPHLITTNFFDGDKLISIAKKINETESTNVSCIKNQKILTYERGVNGITKSCGSACMAATQYKLNYRSYKNKIMIWRCLGGDNIIDTETYSLMGHAQLEI